MSQSVVMTKINILLTLSKSLLACFLQIMRSSRGGIGDVLHKYVVVKGDRNLMPVFTKRDIDRQSSSKMEQCQLVSAEAPGCCLWKVPAEWTEPP